MSSARRGQVPLRRAVLAVFVIGALAAAAGSPVRSSHFARVTGDEPHYLLTAISLAEDRSLDLADELAARRYRPFHEIELRPQAARLVKGRFVSPHDPLLPLLMALPAVLAGWVGAKLSLSMLAGMLSALTLWTAVRRFGVPLSAAVVVVTTFAISAPLAIYGSQIYPEVPAALALMIAIACLTGPLRVGGLAGVCAATVALCWLSIKFAPVAAALALICFVRLARQHRFKAALGVAAAISLAGLAYVVAHLDWYGGLTPYAAGSHFAATSEFSVIGRRPNLLRRSARLIGLLVDRRFGLAAWQPAWLLIIPAFASLLRRRPPGWAPLVLPTLLGWLTATFVALTMHGWWFPGRQVVVVLPAAAVAVAIWAGRSRSRTLLAAGTGALGAVSYLWLLADGWRGQITFAVDFTHTSNLLYRLWSHLLPDYMIDSSGTWALHAAWVVAAMTLALAGAGARPKELRRFLPRFATSR